jgi:hypothetical protein
MFGVGNLEWRAGMEGEMIASGETALLGTLLMKP